MECWLARMRPLPLPSRFFSAVSPVPSISVVIPVFNTASYLERCLDSVLGQSHQALEVLAVNDGSTDASGEILAAYGRRDARVRVLEQPNAGLAAARNRGIAEARGEFVAFVDSDDYVDPEMLALLLQQMEAEDADIGICQFEEVDEDGNVLKVSDVPVGLSQDQWFRRILAAADSSMACNKLFRRAVLEDSGVRFPVGLLHEDVPVVVQLIYAARSVAVVPRPLYSWVRREGTITSSISTKNVLDLMAGFQLVADFLDREGLLEAYRDEFVRRVAHYSVLFADARWSGLDEEAADQVRALLCAWFDVLGITADDFSRLGDDDAGLRRSILLMLPVDREALDEVRHRIAFLEGRLHELETSNGFWLWNRLAGAFTRGFPEGTRRRAFLTRIAARRGG